MKEELKQLILEHDVISFDMFDTLVFRLLNNAESLFDIIGYKYDIEGFRKIRHDKQSEISRIVFEKNGFPHADFDEIYDYIEKTTSIKNINLIKNYELELELKLNYQNPEMYELYKFALDNNKKVVVTSDMYLKIDFIESILKKCGYINLDKIYLSSKEHKAKFDGTLFDVLKRDNKGKKILHIGDNLKDDYNIAIDKGIDAYRYSNGIQKNDTMTFIESLDYGIRFYISKNINDFWINIGAKAGLLYYSLYSNLIKMNRKKIYFISRDGFNLYKIFQKNNTDVLSQYIYMSRRSLLLAGIDKINDETIASLPPFGFNQTIKEILEYISMDEIFDINDIKTVGFTGFDDRINDIDDINKFKKLYYLKEKKVLEVCKKERKSAIEYFSTIGLEENNLMFDCGWNGSSQYLLESFMKKVYPEKNFEFYYSGIFDNNKSRKQLRNRKHSAFLFDIGKNQDIVSKIQDCIVLMELFFGSNENSVLKYDNGKIVFDDFESDVDYKNKISEGLQLYFDYCLNIFDEIGISLSPYEAIKPLIDLIERPSDEEAINIGNIENVDAFARRKDSKQYIAKLTKEDIKNGEPIIYWKYGLLQRNDIDVEVKKFIEKKCHISLKKDKTHKYTVNIFGIRHPMLDVSGFGDGSEKVIVKEDNEKLPVSFQYDKSRSYLHLNYQLKKSSKVEIYEIIDDSENMIYFVNNNLLIRTWGYLKNIIKKFFRIGKKILRKIYKLFRLITKAVKYAWKNYHFLIPPREFVRLIRKFYNRLINGSDESFFRTYNDKLYRRWLKENMTYNSKCDFDYCPLISFVIPVYNVNKKLLSECLDSILKQSYKNLEICIADDCSTNPETIETLKKYETKDKRIKIVYREKNGHISNASNSALSLVTGEYVAMMDNDDVIPSYAIAEMVRAINKDTTIDMIYTDEDKLDLDGKRCDPHFKSDYAPDTLMSVNYFCHFTLLKTSILKDIGGWTVGYEGAQDWDLFLRFVEKAKNIYHLPKVLYHWRMIPGSTSMTLDNKNYAAIATEKLLADALKRRKTPGVVHLHDKVPYYWIEYTYKKEPKISIIIPTRDYADTLETCLYSVFNNTDYSNYEVIVVDNNSKEKETFDLFDRYKKTYKNFKVVDAKFDFNYSKINNIAVTEAKGEYVVLLNNDTEIITKDWLKLMVGYAMQKHVGAVGAKLLYPDDTIQHGGVILGMGGVAGHTFVNDTRHALGDFGRLCVPYNYSAVTAACLMVKKDKYLEVGGLTEALKVAYNDVDFCLKLQKAGYHNVMMPLVELYHYESKSRGMDDDDKKIARLSKEVKYMYDHWGNLIENDPMYNENLSRKAVFYLDFDNK